MLRPICISIAVLVSMSMLCAEALALPDNRAYELVTPVDKNGSTPGDGVSATSGNAIDWSSGPLEGATNGVENLYRSERTPTGWQTRGLTPAPPVPLGLLQVQASLFWTPDLSQTIFTTPESYDPSNSNGGALNLYLESANGQLTWISQGTQGGTAHRSATFDGATPDASQVVFSSEESLLPQAVGMQPGGGARAAQDYLYVRDVPAGETHLVDVQNNGELVSAEGAILGNGTELVSGEPPENDFLPADTEGTTTHAISNDGSKIFFESPPPSSLATPPVHLYMREDSSVTVPIDNPASPGAARYAGASEDGSFAFFTSTEGLGGDPFTDNELYDFNTATRAVAPLSAGSAGDVDGQFIGVIAIANDGSHVYFAAKAVLASNKSAEGTTAKEGEANLYVYDTQTGSTTFITTLAITDVEPEPGRANGPLDSEPDIGRSAQTTPNGSVLVFNSSGNFTGQNSSGFIQVYRYDATEGSLLCISCTPPGVTPVGDSTVGGSGGGSYAPPARPATMSADGSRIFFDSANPLVPEDVNTGLGSNPFDSYDVYEWENGTVSLISGGREAIPSLLDGTTPSGNDVFFTTAESLVPQDTDGGYYDIYDARVSGGFPPPAGTSIPCEGVGCRTPFAAPPSFETPGSALLQGAPSPPPAAVALKPTPKPKVKPRAKTKLKRRARARRHRKSEHAGRRTGAAVVLARSHRKAGGSR